MKTYNGQPFIVIIDRSTMERRYVLQTLDEDGTRTDQNKPLTSEEFEDHFGFYPEWPYLASARKHLFKAGDIIAMDYGVNPACRATVVAVDRGYYLLRVEGRRLELKLSEPELLRRKPVRIR